MDAEKQRLQSKLEALKLKRAKARSAKTGHLSSSSSSSSTSPSSSAAPGSPSHSANQKLCPQVQTVKTSSGSDEMEQALYEVKKVINLETGPNSKDSQTPLAPSPLGKLCVVNNAIDLVSIKGVELVENSDANQCRSIGYVATRDIEPGELLLAETPWAVTPDQGEQGIEQLVLKLLNSPSEYALGTCCVDVPVTFVFFSKLLTIVQRQIMSRCAKANPPISVMQSGAGHTRKCKRVCFKLKFQIIFLISMGRVEKKGTHN